MTDPRRLKDEYAGDVQGKLLRSVAGDAPRGNARHRTLLALGFGGTALGIPTATAAAAATKVSSAVTIAIIAKWIGVGVGAAAITLGAVYEVPRVMGRGHSSAAVATDERVSAVLPEGDVSLSPVATVPTIEENRGGVPAVDGPAPAATHVPRMVAPVTKDTAPGSTSAPGGAVPERSLSDQVTMLDSARQMMGTNPAGTLRALDDYQTQFPHGDLAPEALVLRIEALVRSGQQGAADKLGRDYLARNPGSPHAHKIRTLLGTGPSQ